MDANALSQQLRIASHKDLNAEQRHYEAAMKRRPHLVILGAGATVAALPKGDKNGKAVSCMEHFLERTGLSQHLKGIKLYTPSDNLEDIFSELYERSRIEPKCKEAIKNLEDGIYRYFADVSIPDDPTIYDLLLLGLKEKDVVATFNWDPLIFQAAFRIKRLIPTLELPLILCLHGNTAICFENGTNKLRYWPQGIPGEDIAKRCKLLYPIKNKDYESEGNIKDAWDMLRGYLKIAYLVTIFGYSAPKSDTAAINMLKDAWGKVEDRNLEEIEIIDIKTKEEVYSVWKDFIYSNHYTYANSFFNSSISKYPRRTVESLFDGTMNCLWQNPNRGFKEGADFKQIKDYIKPFLLDEALCDHENDGMLTNPFNDCFKWEEDTNI